MSTLVLSAYLLAILPATAQVITMPVTWASQLTPRPNWCDDTFADHRLTQSALDLLQAVGGRIDGDLNVAVDDLDLDGDLDIVVAQRDKATLLLWNQGDFTFQPSTLPNVGARALNILDLDHDGSRDLLLINGAGVVQFFRNQGHEQFTLDKLPGVNEAAEAMVWHDLDGDGDFDLASVGPGGLTYYSNRDGRFFARRLAVLPGYAQLSLIDLNDDGRQDLVAGQATEPTVQVWLRMASSWATAPSIHPALQPSLPMADLNNDGVLDPIAKLAGLDESDATISIDLDNDGDLDLVAYGAGRAVRLLENRLCAGDALQVQLEWQRAANRDAVGARVTLHTSLGDQVRSVGLEANSEQSTISRLYWGLPPQATLDGLEVRWPDGIISRLDNVPRNAILTIRRQSEPNFTLVAGP